MPIYSVSAHVTVSAYTEVEAENEEEAKTLATGRPAVLCKYGQRRDGCDVNEEFLIEEADGYPEIIHVEEKL